MCVYVFMWVPEPVCVCSRVCWVWRSKVKAGIYLYLFPPMVFGILARMVTQHPPRVFLSPLSFSLAQILEPCCYAQLLSGFWRPESRTSLGIAPTLLSVVQIPLTVYTTTSLPIFFIFAYSIYLSIIALRWHGNEGILCRGLMLAENKRERKRGGG